MTDDGRGAPAGQRDRGGCRERAETGAAAPVRAAVITAPRQVTLGPVILPDTGPGDVLLRVEACGICGSNLHTWADPAMAIERGGSARPGAAGHEISAVVVATGEAVTGLRTGDRVCVEPTLATACGRCDACREGRAWFCRQRAELAVWGFADGMVVPRRCVIPAPCGVDPAVVSLAEPLACGVHALRHSWTAAGSGGRLDGRRVAVVGAGVAGLLAVAAARHLGAASIGVFARYPHQARRADHLGADETVMADAPGAADRLRAMRPDLVVEAVGGSADSFGIALGVVAPGGEVAVLGLFDRRQSLDTRRANFREIRLFFPVTYASLGGCSDFSVAVDVIAARAADLTHLITHRFPLEEIGRAFRAADDKSRGALRVVVQP